MRRLLLVLLSTFLLVSTGTIWAQDEPAPPTIAAVDILSVDGENFPTVALAVKVQDSAGNGIDNLAGLTIFEDENPVEKFDSLALNTGIDVTFVIDANRTIAGIDLIGGVPRAAKVRTAIANFATQYIGRNGKDSVSVIVSAGDGAAFLFEDLTDSNAIVEGIAKFDPQELPPSAPVEAMLQLAFTQAAMREPTNKYQAIVLFSDAENLANQVDFFAVRESATLSDAVFFGAVLGKFASPGEYENMGELHIPTGGYSVHMPEAIDMTPIYDTIRSNANVQEIRFRSEIAESGTHNLSLLLAGVQASTTFEAVIEPPQITFVNEGIVVIRQGDEGDSAETLTPNTRRIDVQVAWPDGNPRTLTDVRFFVNDLEQLLPFDPIFDETGLLTFEWDITNLRDGNYALEVELTDELGIITRSAKSDHIIDVVLASQPIIEEVIINTPTPTPAPTQTPTPREEVVAQVQPYLTEKNIRYALYSLIPLLGLVLLGRLWKRRKVRVSAETEQANPAPLPVLPENVYLELLQEKHGYSETVDMLKVKGESTTIGSDPFRADLVLDSDSVSRLHATVKFENGGYVLYDEGSAYGSRVNFDRVGLAPRPIKDGDTLGFGDIETKFRILGSDPEAYEQLRKAEDPPAKKTITAIAMPRDDGSVFVEPEVALAPPEPEPEPIKYKSTIIFDLDGTLVNSEILAYKAWRRTIGDLGYIFSEKDNGALIGMRMEESLAHIIGRYNITLSPQELYNRLEGHWSNLARTGIPPMPGVTQLVKTLAERNIRWGLATASPRNYAENILDQLELTGVCVAIAGGDEVVNSKPSPDIYLLAAERMGVNPADCVAVEDSVVGHRAAAAAGMTVVAVPNEWSDSAEFTEADYICKNLNQLRAMLDTILEY